MNTLYVVFTHEYFLVFYGLIIWHLIRWYRAHQKAEKDDHFDFDFRDWAKREKNDIIISLAFAPLVIVFDDEVLMLINKIKDTGFYEMEKWMYPLSGFIINRLVVWLLGKGD